MTSSPHPRIQCQPIPDFHFDNPFHYVLKRLQLIHPNSHGLWLCTVLYANRCLQDVGIAGINRPKGGKTRELGWLDGLSV